MIKIVYKKPNEKPHEMEVENTLEKFQELVGGYIEAIPANDDGSIIMVVDEEGRLKDLEVNIWIGNEPIVGNVVFVRNTGDGEFSSLTDDMVKAIIKLLS